MSDLAIVGQDPGFAGGLMAQTEALWEAAVAIGRQPELHYLEYRRLDATRADARLQGRGVRPVVPGLEVLNVLAEGALVAGRIRDARARFVCAATASSGCGAVLARRPYGCWISTTLSEERASRRRGLGPGRRIAYAASDPGLRAIERAALRGATVRWAVSPATRRAVAGAAGIAETEIRIVPVPIDTRRFSPLPDKEWELGLEAPELIFVGRGDDPRKNVGLLLDGFERLRSRLPAVRLTLIGTAPATRLPYGVEAAGIVPSVSERLCRASLFVLPSLQEGFGIVVAEALSAGVPVLVTPSGGPEELVRSSGGGEVMSGFDPAELAERAEALLGNPGRLREMRRLGRDHVVREHDPLRLQAALREALEVLDHGR